MHTNRNIYYHIGRDIERNSDGGDSYTSSGCTTTASGSPPVSLSSSPTTSFYNLQIYSTPSYNNTNTNPNTNNNYSLYPQHSSSPVQIPAYNLYQSVQEVPYHPAAVDNKPTYPARSTPSPIPSAPEKDHRNGITFTNPFVTPSPTASSQSSEFYSNNINSHRKTVNSQSSCFHSGEAVIQPIYATFGTESIFVTCPYCHNTDSTITEQVVGSEALLWACIIPWAGFLLKSKWDTHHRCKRCLNVIGIYYP